VYATGEWVHDELGGVVGGRMCEHCPVITQGGARGYREHLKQIHRLEDSV
jgi:hypothetical protein